MLCLITDKSHEHFAVDSVPSLRCFNESSVPTADGTWQCSLTNTGVLVVSYSPQEIVFTFKMIENVCSSLPRGHSASVVGSVCKIRTEPEHSRRSCRKLLKGPDRMTGPLLVFRPIIQHCSRRSGISLVRTTTLLVADTQWSVEFQKDLELKMSLSTRRGRTRRPLIFEVVASRGTCLLLVYL